MSWTDEQKADAGTKANTTEKPKPKKASTGQNRLPDPPASEAGPPPPHSVEAEKGVLSSIMRSPSDAITKCAEAGLFAGWFYVPAHCTIYRELQDMWDSGEAIDLITFTARLRGKELLEEVGGAAAVTDVQSYLTKIYEYAQTAANLPYYIEIVRDRYMRRLIIAGAANDTRRAYDPDPKTDMGALLDEITSRALSLRSLHGRNGTQMEDAADMLAKPIVTPPDVIEGILYQGAKAAFAGGSKAYKTWLLIELAASVATGSPCLCLNGASTTKGQVFYVNFELSAPYFWKRVRAVCEERQLTIEPGMLTAVHLRGHVADWPRVQRQIPPGQFVLIIVDPIYKPLLLLGRTARDRDENSAGPIATLLDQMEILAVRTGAAVAFGEHYSKGNQAQKEAIDRPSGSGVFARDPDAIITFTKHKQQDCFSVELTLRVHPPVEPFVLHWEYPLFVPDSTLNPADLKQRNKGAAEKQYTLSDLVELFDRPMLLREIREATTDKMSERTFYRLWDEGKADGAFRKHKNGTWKVNPKWKPE